MREIQGLIAEGTPAPRYLTTGPMITVPGGYPGTPLHGPVHSPAEVAAKLDEIQALGGVGVKIAIESIGGAAAYPPEIRDAILTGARQRGLPIYAHATAPRDQVRIPTKPDTRSDRWRALVPTQAEQLVRAMPVGA